ncbi:MAG: serine acetyltransferase [Clostridia bacterium]|nr:serine acetyltransferase [Clostridia bacterium]
MRNNLNGRFSLIVNQHLHHYNHNRYWKKRQNVLKKSCGALRRISQLYDLYYIKKSDAFNCASFGTDLGQGAEFATPPHLPHGPNGIIVSKFAKIGSNCKIYHQVTIATKNINGEFVSATIGDNCTLGAKCTVVGGVKIGNNVKVGANAVVTKDVPDNCTVAGVPAKIIKEMKLNDN